MKRIAVLAGWMAVVVAVWIGEGRTAVAPAPQPISAEILWDRWGVPHVFADNDPSLFYAFAWAQMHSHGNLILRLYGQARGRAAEYWGPDYLDSDRWVRTVGIPERAEQWWRAQSPTFRNYLRAFADGINAYARKHPERIADDVEVVLPVRPVDVLAHTQRVIHFTFVANPREIARLRRRSERGGSNAWAIGPRRSASGHAMLLANPHLPWSDLFLFYEVHLIGPDVNAYGATLVGMPNLGIAFNQHLGWTHTVNTYDGSDLYALTPTKDGYMWNGKPKPFDVERQVIQVKQADGSLRQEPLVIRRSVHGPVVAQRGGKLIALRVAGLDRPDMMAQYWDMMRARNLAEFEKALQRMQLPMFNVVYADRDGHIFYLFNGQVPVRPRGDWQLWRGIVPGESSATLWNRTHRYSELPRLADPTTGWLQNANDPPWTCTIPQVLKADQFPKYMAPRFMHLRAQRSARMLMEDDDITLDELVQYKLSTRMEAAERLLDDLIPAARKHGGDLAQRAADVLAKWDRCADSDSRGAVLFAWWYLQEMRPSGPTAANVFATPWSPDQPTTTPDHLADPKRAVKALESAAAKVQAQYGTLDVPWGKVFRLRAKGIDLPANGATGGLGAFRVVQYGRGDDGRFEARGGDSYVAAIEFSNPVRARVLLSYGNSTQPGSPHAYDQLPLFAKKKLRPAWLTRAQIEKHLESREVLKR